MKNHEIARLLYQIADLLELKDENIFKIRAYRRAAQAIDSFSRSAEDLYKDDALGSIPGIGVGIAEKIEEYLETGKIKYLERLKKSVPVDMESLSGIEGLGPRKIKILYDGLKIRNAKDLEKAIAMGKLRKLRGFGEKTEENLKRSLTFSASKRMLLGYALPIADEIMAYMKKLSDVKDVNAAGSLRRMKETVGDIDILVSSSHPEKVIDHFCAMPDVFDVLAMGPTKASVRMRSGLQVDLRVLRASEYGAALMYFTGSKEHNIEMRKIAIAKRMKLSEYGLFSGAKIVAGRTEEEVYAALGMQCVEPEMREMRGEIELAKKHALPELIRYGDVKGDLQMHSKWSDGVNTIEQLASAAKAMNYEYICVTDHLGNLKIAHAMSESAVGKQAAEIEKVSEKTGMKILHGAEIDIRVDGRLEISSGCLKKFDIVLASLHSALKRPSALNTDRIIMAMQSPHVDVIAHPTGRLIEKRDGADLDMQKIIKTAVGTGTALEINAYPNRLDLNDANAFAAREAGCALTLGTDAHSTEHLRFMRLGVGVARRAWCEKKHVLNTLPYSKLAKHFDISK